MTFWRYVLAFMGFLALAISEGIYFIIFSYIKPILTPVDLDDAQFTFTLLYICGCIITQVCSVVLRSKAAVSLAMSSTTILIVMFPRTPTTKTWLLVAVAVLGLTQGMILPALNNMLSQWTPTKERARMGTLVYIGGPVATLFAVLLLKLLRNVVEIDRNKLFSTMCYVYGIVGIIWIIIWVATCYDTPEKHPVISEYEQSYLTHEISDHILEKRPPTPWIRVLTSMPFWALVVVHVGYQWGLYTVENTFDMYRHVHLKDHDHDFELLITRYYGMLLLCLVMSFGSDFMIMKNYLSIANIRKIGTTTAFIVSAIFIVFALRANTVNYFNNIYLLAFAFLGCGICSFKINTLDISPNHAGTVIAVCNGVGVVFSKILIPNILECLTDDEDDDKTTYSKYFWTTFGILMVTNLFYSAFASGKIQYWNDRHVAYGIKNVRGNGNNV